MCEAAKLVMSRGARQVYAAATHPVLVGLAMERIADAPICSVIVTDTIPCGQRCKPIESKLRELSVAELLGDAIDRNHNNKSVSRLNRLNGIQNG